MTDPEPYSEEEKRLAKIHRCHPQDIRDFGALIQHIRKTQASTLLVLPKIPKSYDEPLALKHSIQLEKIERVITKMQNEISEIKERLDELEDHVSDLEDRVDDLEKAQREESVKTKKED